MFLSIGLFSLLVIFFIICIYLLGSSIKSKTVLKVVLIIFCLIGLYFSGLMLRLVVTFALL